MALSILQKAIYFILALGILVFVHELGHYLFARALGVKVLRFCIGFGTPLAKFTSKKTGIEYALAAIPLGGYVKMLDTREGEVPEELMPQEFNSQPIWKRFLIVFAGPLFNYVFAILVFWMVFLGGEFSLRPIIGEVIPGTIAANSGLQPGDEVMQIDQKQVTTFSQFQLELMTAGLQARQLSMVVKRGGQQASLLVDMTDFDPADHIDSFSRDFGILSAANRSAAIEAIPNDPAYVAGLRDGDKIVSVDAEKVLTWNEMARKISGSSAEQIAIVVDRNGQELQFLITPKIVTEGELTRRVIGVKPAPVRDDLWVKVDHTLISAFNRGVEESVDSIEVILKGVWSMITGTASVKNLSGPIQIANTVGKFAEYGIVQLARLLALLSISLGILNLLPIPVLDGGHLFFYLVEAIRGRPLEPSSQEKFQTVGLAILAMIMGLAFYVDLQRVFN